MADTNTVTIVIRMEVADRAAAKALADKLNTFKENNPTARVTAQMTSILDLNAD